MSRKINSGISIQWNITQKYKGPNCWYTQLGWISEALCRAKEASLKIFLPYDCIHMIFSKKTKVIENRSVVAKDDRQKERWVQRNNKREFMGNVTVSTLIMVVVTQIYPCVEIHWNKQPKKSVLLYAILIFNKSEKKWIFFFLNFEQKCAATIENIEVP